jgi:hypothetical protein
MAELQVRRRRKSVVDPDQLREIIPATVVASTLVHASRLWSPLGQNLLFQTIPSTVPKLGLGTFATDPISNRDTTHDPRPAPVAMPWRDG